MQEDNQLLVVENVHLKTRENISLLEDISFRLDKGKMVGIVGPNGAGKTTLLRLIYGMLQPTKGSISLGGRAFHTYSARQRAQRIASVLQEMPQSFDLKVFEVVQVGRVPFETRLKNGNERYAFVVEALTQTNSLPLAERSFQTLSGGEKQRVLLARALVQEPQLLLLDEPTNHLDLKHQWGIMQLVESLACAKLCVLHDLTLAAHFCQEILLLHNGKVFAYGVPAEVFTAENIKTVFEVEVEVILNTKGKPQIMMGR